MSPNSFPPPALWSVPSTGFAGVSWNVSAGLRLFRPEPPKNTRFRIKISGQLRAISPTDRPDSPPARAAAPVGRANVRIYVVNLRILVANVGFRAGRMRSVLTNVLLSGVKPRSLVRNVPFLSKRGPPEVPIGGECRIGRFVAIPHGKTLQTAVLLPPGLLPGRGQPPAQRLPTASPPWRPAGRSRPSRIRAVR